MNAPSFQRALVESTVGHFVVAGLAAFILTIAQCARPLQPDEVLMDVALIAGPKSAGEEGAPPPEPAAPENKPAPVVPAPPPPPPPEPVTPPIVEPKPVEIPKPVEPPKPPKPVEKPKPEERTPPRDTPPPSVHQVKVNTNRVVLLNKPAETPPNTSKTPPKNNLSKEVLAMLQGMKPSKAGGAGVGGGPPGSIARGTPSSGMDIYKAMLKVKIMNAWSKPPGAEGLLTIVHISIARDGTILSARITRRSGNDLLDNSAMQALRDVRPAPLPAGVDAPYDFDVEFEASGVRV